MTQKVVICGAGFLGSSIARTLAASAEANKVSRTIQLTSRRPERLHKSLALDLPPNSLLAPVSCDVTKPNTLDKPFEGANMIVSLVGIMNGTPKDFEDIQWKGAENVAKAARRAGAKLIHVSAIGADASSDIPYNKTKALAELSVLEHCPDATIIRPSLFFGPGDSFFNRFSTLSKFIPFLPVFGGGTSRFQPVYVGDVSRSIEIISRQDPEIRRLVDGKILEAGGPEVYTYREIMELVLRYNGRRRPVVSLPFAVGALQGALMEYLPQNLFTVTRSQVEQLKSDNIVDMSADTRKFAPFQYLVETYSGEPLKSVHEILPSYL